MRRSVLAVLLALALLLSAHAKPPAPAPIPPVASMAAEGQLIEHGHYVNSSGNVVHSPAHTTTGAPPA